jgi:DNA modification methylase
MTTTLWDFPSRQYGEGRQGQSEYEGATPAPVIWNLLQRFTAPGETVLDPMAGSGTTLDVARDLGRKAIGFDLNIVRPDVTLADARKIPLEDESVDFVFIDPPYSTHIRYSDDPRCIGKLSAGKREYFEAMERVLAEIARVLRPGRHMGLYVCDSFEKGKPLRAIGLELLSALRRHFECVDIVAVVRRNRDLLRANHHMAALREGFLLRGFNYLFIMRKLAAKARGRR